MASTKRLQEREPKLLARDTAYAITGVVDDAVTTVRSIPGRVEQLREDAPQRIRALPQDAQSSIEERRARAEADFRARFDSKAESGADRVATLRSDDRVARIEAAFAPVGDQVKVARSQVKGAITSVRKTIDVALEAGRTQAGTARTQVRAAATSTRRTVDAAVGAGRDLAS